jgi:hypothetical protein
MRIALIHDHLTQKGGAEKVLEAFSELYPNAPITWQTTGTIIVSAIFYKEYTAAPMTPSFWNKQIHDFGFEKATATESVRQRHHARF